MLSTPSTVPLAAGAGLRTLSSAPVIAPPTNTVPLNALTVGGDVITVGGNAIANIVTVGA